MKSIPVTDLREDLTNMIEYVRGRDEGLIVTKRGKPVAILTPFESRMEKILQRQWFYGNVSERTAKKQ